jgi:hypothetical protein
MLSFVPDQFLISPGQRPNELLPLHGAHLWYNFGHKWVCFMNDINSSFFFGGVYKIAVSYQYFLLTIKLIKSNISKLWPKLYQRCAPCNGKSSFGLWPGEIRNWSEKLNFILFSLKYSGEEHYLQMVVKSIV